MKVNELITKLQKYSGNYIVIGSNGLPLENIRTALYLNEEDGIVDEIDAIMID